MKRRLLLAGPQGSTAIFAICGYKNGQVLTPETNTNLMSSRTVLPTLHAAIPAGTTTLICAVCADAGDAAPNEIPEEVMNVAQSC